MTKRSIWVAALAMTLALAGTARADYRSAVMADGPSNYFRMGEAGDAAGVLENEVSGELDGYHENAPVTGLAGALEQESPNLAIGYLGDPDVDRSVFPIDFLVPTYDKFAIEFFLWTGVEPPAASPIQWYQGYGLVDGEIAGVTTDAGTAIVEDGKVGFGMGDPDTTIASTKPVNDGFWHHVVATHDGEGLMRLYVDGVLEAEKSGGPSAPRTNMDIAIGALQTNFGHFPGIVDEVAFYRHVLTGADVAEHYAASGRFVPAPREVGLHVSVQGHGVVLGPAELRCPPDCSRSVPEGSTHDFFAFPDTGHRFGGFHGPDCAPLPEASCRVFADAASFESISAAFYPAPKTLATGMQKAVGVAAGKVEGVLDDCVNPRKGKKASCNSIPIALAAPAIGDAGASLVTKGPAKLVGNAGNTLVGNAGNTFKQVPPSTLISDKGVGLIGSDGGSLIGSDGGSLIGSDGGSLIGSDGGSLIGPDGGSRVNTNGQRIVWVAGASKKKKAKRKPRTYVLATFSAPSDGSGSVAGTMKLTKQGKKVIKAFGAANSSLKKAGKKPIALPATFVAVIRPADGTGTAGSFKALKIK